MKKFEIEISFGQSIGFVYVTCNKLKQTDVDILIADGVEITFGGPVEEILSITEIGELTAFREVTPPQAASSRAEVPDSPGPESRSE